MQVGSNGPMYCEYIEVRFDVNLDMVMNTAKVTKWIFAIIFLYYEL